MQQTQNFVEFMKSIKQKQLYMMGFPYRSFVKYRGKKKVINQKQKINLSQLEDSPQIKLAFKRLNIKGFKDNIFYYETSTWGGQSGGPILILNKQTHEYQIIGVHTGGQKNQNKNRNYGLIFNPSLLKKLSENKGTINSSQQQILQYNSQYDRQSEVISNIQSLSLYNSKQNKQWKYCKTTAIQCQENKNYIQKYSGSLININETYYLITAKVTLFSQNKGNMKCLMVKQYSQNNNKTNIIQRQYHQVNCEDQQNKQLISIKIVDNFIDNNFKWLVKIILYKISQKIEIKKDNSAYQIQHNQTNLQKDKFFIIGFTRSKTKTQNSNSNQNKNKNSNQNTLMDYYYFQEIKIKKHYGNYIYYDSNSDLGLVGAGIVKGHPENNNNFKLIGIHINSNQKTKQSFGILLRNNVWDNFKDFFNITFKRQKIHSSSHQIGQKKRKIFITQQKTLYKPIPKINPNQVQIRSSRTMRNERRKKQQKYSRSQCQWSDSQFSN